MPHSMEGCEVPRRHALCSPQLAKSTRPPERPTQIPLAAAVAHAGSPTVVLVVVDVLAGFAPPVLEGSGRCSASDAAISSRMSNRHFGMEHPEPRRPGQSIRSSKAGLRDPWFAGMRTQAGCCRPLPCRTPGACEHRGLPVLVAARRGASELHDHFARLGGGALNGFLGFPAEIPA